jgi:hypothetical protein
LRHLGLLALVALTAGCGFGFAPASTVTPAPSAPVVHRLHVEDSISLGGGDTYLGTVLVVCDTATGNLIYLWGTAGGDRGQVIVGGCTKA